MGVDADCPNGVGGLFGSSNSFNDDSISSNHEPSVAPLNSNQHITTPDVVITNFYPSAFGGDPELSPPGA